MASAVQWNFVSIHENGRVKDVHTRKTVRQHAMRAFRREERLARVKSFEEMQAKGSTNGKDKITKQGKTTKLDWGKDALGGPKTRALSTLQPAPSRRLNPFSSRVLLTDEGAGTLLWHCKFTSYAL